AWRMLEPRRGAFENADGDENEADSVQAHGSIGKDFQGSMKKLRHIPTYWTLVAALVFSFFTIGGTSFWLPSYFVNAFHLSLGSAGLITAAVLVGSGLIGTLAGGWLADFVQRRRPEGRLLVAAFGFLVGAPLVLMALLFDSLLVFIAVFVLAAVSLSFCTGPLHAVIQDVIAPALLATAVGLLLLVVYLVGGSA